MPGRLNFGFSNQGFSFYEKLQMSFLCLITMVSMMLTGYLHLDFVSMGIRNISLKDILDIWPIISLAISILLLGVSALLFLTFPSLATTIAFIGVITGWFYYILVTCTLFLLVSILVFSPKGLAMFFPQCLLLYLTTRSVINILKRA